jgi:catechol 2,3-dioxygenase-like lactoylglutathione lyase family enzyme
MAWAAHICLEVSGIEETWKRLIAAGASAQGEVALVDNGPVRGLKAGYLRDPEGILIELIEVPEPPSP